MAEASDLLPEDFTVGWICALPHELAASRAMLDVDYGKLEWRIPHDNNIYVAGRIGNFNIALTCLPAGIWGIESAASAAKDMARTFPAIEHRFLVGIGGGVPDMENDIRLGDVVVSKPMDDHGGVIHYEKGKLTGSGFIQRGHLNKPPYLLLNALHLLSAKHEQIEPATGKYLEDMLQRYPRMRRSYARPENGSDVLLDQDGKQVTRAPRLNDFDQEDMHPAIHYGLIASSNKIIASSEERRRLRSQAKILCFETEAAGIMNSFSAIIIRGISNYSDEQKHDGWQGYAAAAAAAYAKELLLQVPAAVADHRSRSSVARQYATSNARPDQLPMIDLPFSNTGPTQEGSEQPSKYVAF